MCVHVDSIYGKSLNTVNIIPEDPYNTEWERQCFLTYIKLV